MTAAFLTSGQLRERRKICVPSTPKLCLLTLAFLLGTTSAVAASVIVRTKIDIDYGRNIPAAARGLCTDVFYESKSSRIPEH